MGSVRSINSCRICGNTELVQVLDLGEQALTGIFPRERDTPLTRGPLELVKCHGRRDCCGLVQLRHSYDVRELYGYNYAYRSSLNRSMVEHLSNKVQMLRRRVHLTKDDVVLDIGSNDGTTLSFYPETVTRIGMDPTAGRFRHLYQPEIRVIEDFFSADRFREEVADRTAKIITSIAMFYDLEQPLDFVNQVASVLDEDGIWHFEQSYMPLMLSQNAYDTICHEHLEYYALKQVAWMLNAANLKIIDVELNSINGGSFAVSAAKASASFPGDQRAVARVIRHENEAGVDQLEPFNEFAQRVFEHREHLLELLVRLKKEGSSVLGYGASTKGNVILQFCGLTSDDLPAIAEVNEDKYGCFTPGTGIPIISEADARRLAPDYFLVMPWHFRENLLQREDEFLKRGGQMIFPLPQIEVVGRTTE